MNFQRMTDLDLAGKRVLIREDLNVPVKNGEITSDARLRAALPTIKAALDKGAAVMVFSHLGRPVEGEPKPEQSLAPVAAYLTKALGQDVKLFTDYLDGVEVEAGQVVLLENVRFNHGEKKNNEELAKNMQHYVMYSLWMPLVQHTVQKRQLKVQHVLLQSQQQVHYWRLS